MLKFLSAILLLSMMSCSSHLKSAGDSSPGKVVTAPGFKVWRNAVYTPEGWPEALRADIYEPKGDGPWPGVLLIHGGGWAKTDRRSDMESIAGRLARRGYVVMNATYRLAPKYHYPAPVQDLQEAMRWFRARGDTFNLDPRPMAVFGYSAGGHLAALLGSMDDPNTPPIKAVVAGGAPVDLRKYPGPGLIADFIGGVMTEYPDAYVEASPVTHISPDDPPVFLYHGGFDLLVRSDQPVDYRKALTAAGVPNELFWIRGRGHVIGFLSDGAAVRAAIKFLDRQFR
ncbi:alpha/beta hydrolase [Phragmitibacter flavus]|uniref:Alpha/beta hydrolase n=2 Tax=Phragmitibacter flavus TaxID=2576071 RepID=A0A5R8KCQ4_9BACT|nr:alpha/beta hydrolase [Phragmitibacter flavus]